MVIPPKPILIPILPPGLILILGEIEPPVVVKGVCNVSKFLITNTHWIVHGTCSKALSVVENPPCAVRAPRCIRLACR